jgi:hypothetical protein
MKQGRDPYWTVARWAGKDADGQPVRKGDSIFYYPNTRTVLTGERAKQASAEFAAARFDEAQMTGQW